MHMKFKITKKELLHFCGERHVAGDRVFSNDLLFVWLEGNRIRFAIVSILCWSWGAESLAASAGRRGRDGQVGYPVPRDPGEAKPKVYVVLGWAGLSVSSAN